jgi:hypothetical protein
VPVALSLAGNGASKGTMRFANFDGEVADVAAAKAFLEQEFDQRVIGLLGASRHWWLKHSVFLQSS